MNPSERETDSPLNGTLHGESHLSVSCVSVSRVGCLVCSSLEPEILSEVSLELSGIGVLRAQVVRQLTALDASRWRLPQGFFVAFLEPTARQRVALDERGQGLTSDLEVEVALEALHGQLAGEVYAVLGVPGSSPMQTVVEALWRRDEEASALSMRLLSVPQTRQLEAVQQRLRVFRQLVGEPVSRALYDASHSNWRGIAASLASGALSDDALSQLRDRVRVNSHAVERGQVHVDEARLAARQSLWALALSHIELALGYDPLQSRLHHLRFALLGHLNANV
jgi:hypothetical protein